MSDPQHRQDACATIFHQPSRTFSGTKYHRDGYSEHLPVVLRLE